MSRFCGVHRLPQAGVDPIDSELVAFSMLAHVVWRPMRHEIIALLLDHEHRGISVLVVADTEPPDALFDVIDVLVDPGRGGDLLGAVVLATVRPDDTLDPRDVDRWLEASAVLGDHGIELLEWFVIGREVSCPRDLLGEPPRWRR